MSRTICEVVIVGAGVLGCSTAFHLSQSSGTRVIVVEKGAVASGMTKRSGALIHSQIPNATVARLALASQSTFQHWNQIVGGDGGFTRTGLVVAAGKKDEERLRQHIAELERLGAKTKRISSLELKELQPHANVDDIALAAYEPDAGFADPLLTTQSLAARAKQAGVVFKTGTMYRNLRVNAGRVSGVETTAGDIDALAVVLMTGPWTDRLLKPFGGEIGIKLIRADVAFFDRPAELKSGHTAFIDWTTGTHFRPHTFGLTMGGLNTPDVEEKDPNHFDENVPASLVADLQQRIAARLPAMARARYIRGHAGVYETTPDGRPVISRVPGIAGLYVAAGFAGIGFAVAPAVGACMAELVAEGAASAVDITKLEMQTR